MAVGSGFAYYSLSSILITQFKEPSIGLQLATELGLSLIHILLPIGIDQWGAFGYAVIGQWLLVGRGTADKDISVSYTHLDVYKRQTVQCA